MKTLFNLAFAIIILNFNILPPQSQPQAEALTSTSQGSCHFGMTAPYGARGYDLSVLGVDSYLDWSPYRTLSVPENIGHIKALHVGDSYYPSISSKLPGLLQRYPGSFWIIGNEPDAVHTPQDILTPEVYGDRFYAMATLIRSQDPTAKIGFGPIIQPTPLRLRYLDRVWSRLLTLTNNNVNRVKSLIDVYTIHAFILNEVQGQWGASIPHGFEQDHADAIEITNAADTHSISIFKARVIAFRNWMAAKGEKEKPLWITEYGSLLPPYNAPGNNYATVSDELTRDFMLATFDFMYNTTDPAKGYSPDGNRLVQKWFWYSLNELRTKFGGALYDLSNKLPTIIGDAYKQYAPVMAPVPPDLYPREVKILPRIYSNHKTTVDYRIVVRVGNDVVSDWLPQGVVVSVYEGATLIGTASISAPRCGGDGLATFNWPNITPGVAHNLRVVINPPAGVADVLPSNNTKTFTLTGGLPSLAYLPSLYH
jgi:hypothetical protein